MLWNRVSITPLPRAGVTPRDAQPTTCPTGSRTGMCAPGRRFGTARIYLSPPSGVNASHSRGARRRSVINRFFVTARASLASPTLSREPPCGGVAGATALALLWPSRERSYRGPAFGMWAFTRCWSPLWRSESVTGSASVGAWLSVSVIGLEREVGGSNAQVGPRWASSTAPAEDVSDGLSSTNCVDDSPRRKTMRQLVRRFCFLCSPGAALSSLSAALPVPVLSVVGPQTYSFLSLRCPGNSSLMDASCSVRGGASPTPSSSFYPALHFPWSHGYVSC